jgi:hypothetical protein
MKRSFLIAASLAILVLAGCTGESKLPNPTGKGRIHAINAIPGAPEVVFRIEERTLGGLTYKTWSTPTQFDDFEYNFNFDIRLPDQSGGERIASIPFKVEADRDHVFILTGDISNPTITISNTDIRTWDSADTTFEARFLHANKKVGDIDVYFADPSTAPLAGTQVATLSYGDFMDPAEFEQGPYLITITAAGDVDNVYYTSSAQNFSARTSQSIAFLGGNENDTSPHIVSTVNTVGLSLRLPDPAFASTIRFIHAANTLQDVDAYSDETLQTQVASGITFGNSSTDNDIGPEPKTFYFTPAGSTATTLFRQASGAPPASQTTEMFLIGDTDAWRGVYVTIDRASISTIGKVRIFHGSFNHQLVDFYIVKRGVEFTEDLIPTSPVVGFGLLTPPQSITAGGHDIYVTKRGDKVPLAAAYEVDLALGDVVLLQIVDTDDPSTLEFQDVSSP